MEVSTRKKSTRKLVTLAIAASLAHAGRVVWGAANYDTGTSGGGIPNGVGGAGISLNGGAGIKLFGPASMTFDSSQGFVPGQLSGPMIFWDSAGGQPAGVFTTATLPIAYSFSMTDTPPGGGQAHAIGAICLWRKRRERTSFGG